MCSVLFLDIVEYSRKSVGEQISLKERFNSFLSSALGHVPIIDRIILDTGDGAAINFLGDVEDAFKVAISLRKSMLDSNAHAIPPLLVRMGINHGPVRLVQDINGHPNIVGDGINVAQRVMSFADAGQVLVSRSYYDAVSRLSPTYAEMFHYQGARTDKHVREHDVYAIGYPGEKSAPSVEKIPVQKPAPSDDERDDFRKRVLYAVGFVLLLFSAIAYISPHRGKPATPDAAKLVGQSAAASAPVAAPDKHADAQNIHPASAVVHSTKPASGVANLPKTDVVKTNNKTVQVKTVPDGKSVVKPAIEVKPPLKAVDGNADKDIAASGIKVAPPVSAVPPVTTSSVIPAKSSVAAMDSFVIITCIKRAQLFVDGVQIGKNIENGLKVAIPSGKHKLIIAGLSGSLYTHDVDLEPGKTSYITPDFCE